MGSKKSVLMFAPKFFGYEKRLSDAIEDEGLSCKVNYVNIKSGEKYYASGYVVDVRPGVGTEVIEGSL